MNKQLVEFELEDGSSIVMETSRDEGGFQRIARGGDEDAPAKAEKKFKDIASTIGPAAQVILNTLKEINTPEEIQLEFGLVFSAKTGVIIASADTEVNFKVTVKWVNNGAK